MPRERVSSIRKKRTNRKLVRKNTRRTSKKSIGKTRRLKRRSVRRRSVRRTLNKRRSVNKSTRKKSLRKRSRNRRLYGGTEGPQQSDPDFKQVMDAIKGVQQSMKEELRRARERDSEIEGAMDRIGDGYGADGDEAYRYLLEQVDKLRKENQGNQGNQSNKLKFNKKDSILKMYDLYGQGMEEYNRGNFIKARAYFQNIFILLNGRYNVKPGDMKNYPAVSLNELRNYKEPIPGGFPGKNPWDIKDDAAEKIELIATAQNELVENESSTNPQDWEIVATPRTGNLSPKRKIFYKGKELGPVAANSGEVGFREVLEPKPEQLLGIKPIPTVVRDWKPTDVTVTSVEELAQKIRRKSLSGDSGVGLNLTELEDAIKLSTSGSSSSGSSSGSEPGSSSGSESGSDSGGESSQGANTSSDLYVSGPATPSQGTSSDWEGNLDPNSNNPSITGPIKNPGHQRRALAIGRNAAARRDAALQTTDTTTSSDPSDTSTDDGGISPIDRDYDEFLKKLKALETAGPDDNVDERRDEVLEDKKYGEPLRILIEKSPEIQSDITHIVGVGRKTSEYSQFLDKLRKIDEELDEGLIDDDMVEKVKGEIKEDMVDDKPQNTLAEELHGKINKDNLKLILKEYINTGERLLKFPQTSKFSPSSQGDTDLAKQRSDLGEATVVEEQLSTAESQLASSQASSDGSEDGPSGYVASSDSANTDYGSGSQPATSGTNTGSEGSEGSDDGPAGRNTDNTSSVSVSDTITSDDNSTVELRSTDFDELQRVSEELKSSLDSNGSYAKDLSEELAVIPTKEQRRRFLEKISSTTSSEGSGEPQTEPPSQKMARLAIRILELKKSNSGPGSDTESRIDSSLSDEVLSRLNITDGTESSEGRDDVPVSNNESDVKDINVLVSDTTTGNRSTVELGTTDFLDPSNLSSSEKGKALGVVAKAREENEETYKIVSGRNIIAKSNLDNRLAIKRAQKAVEENRKDNINKLMKEIEREIQVNKICLARPF